MIELAVAAIDDEPLALRRLEILLRAIPGVHLAGTAGSCEEGRALVAGTKPDVILLDIRMRDGTGFDFLEQLPAGTAPRVIFVTAFDNYAVQAFEASAVDYLLKPIEPPRLAQALDKARADLAASGSAEQVAELRSVVANLRARIHEQDASPYDRELWIRNAAGGLARVAFKDVLWVTSEEDYVRLHTARGSYLLRLSIKKLEERIDPAQFIRVHRSALVRADQIAEIRSATLGRREVVLKCGERVAIGRIYAKRLKSLAQRSFSDDEAA